MNGTHAAMSLHVLVVPAITLFIAFVGVKLLVMLGESFKDDHGDE